MLDEEQRKIRQEYETKFRDLEKERLAVQDKKAQVRHHCKGIWDQMCLSTKLCFLMHSNSASVMTARTRAGSCPAIC